MARMQSTSVISPTLTYIRQRNDNSPKLSNRQRNTVMLSKVNRSHPCSCRRRILFTFFLQTIGSLHSIGTRQSRDGEAGTWLRKWERDKRRRRKRWLRKFQNLCPWPVRHLGVEMVQICSTLVY